MSWTTPADLKAQLLRLWERGELARQLIERDAAVWPLRLVLKRPSSAELTDRFQAVRDWATTLAGESRLRIEWREVRHRVHGLQRLPDAAWVDSPDAALAWIGRQRDAEKLAQLAAQTRAEWPELVPWLAKRPLQALQLTAAWPRLLAVVRWLRAHPRPAIYLRQVDIPEVDSKFIETHRGVLAELFDLALPVEAIDERHTGIGGFAARYGFLDKPLRLRFRILDARTNSLPGVALPDLALDADSFANLDLAVRRVFITENEINYLAFPPVERAIVIFGSGYGWDALARARWLAHCEIHYWGDIDTHGFAILDNLRAHLPHTRSFLMGRDTLLAHAALWGEEPKPELRDLARLTPEEHALFNDLRDRRIACPGKAAANHKQLRLEQERIGFGHVLKQLSGLLQ